MTEQAPTIEIATAQFQAEQIQASGPGSRGWARFVVFVQDAARLLDEGVLGERAFTVTFDGSTLGTGLTVSSIGGKKDADGYPASGVTFAIPEHAVKTLAKAVLAGVVGKTGKLVLSPDQMSFDELTTKAE